LKHKFKGVAGPCIACYLNTLTSGHFRGFLKKTPKHTWLCVRISPVR